MNRTTRRSGAAPAGRAVGIARFARLGGGTVASAAALGLALTGCSAADTGADETDRNSVTIVVHDSFPNDAFAEAASEATGYDVEVVSAGDGGELTNKLVLTKGAPLGDAFFGVDQVFASRIIDEEVAEPYAPDELPARAADYLADGSDALVPVDFGATCINVDTAWFEREGREAPESFEDLADPAYRDLTVLMDPTASSTGASFLIGTVAHFGEDGYLGYWEDLMANGARIEQGWSDAYYGQFSGSGEGGTLPIVLSYSSSPAATLSEDGASSTTAALLDTCSSQVEYAGVLAGAANPDGARAVVDYMLSGEFQDTIAETMYMYPIDEGATVPEAWVDYAPLPTEPNDLSAAEIGAGLDGWLKAVSETTGL
ncbi:thiamine ABC transporter substrate-binding protein [Leucobacter sp. CSA1]|uniref:Thiamine ABC transporter substrate-binding protein n=2 Tax=Leucobacter chromiisoli TaxID=2796471 RepID=A0A934UVY3_9MICO|nr:thiamine ABC transporter substrate-binding protein [Leucobacter chromiisoli]